MSFSKEAWADALDDLDAPTAMQPIRFEYQTLSEAKRIQVDMLERLGLVYVTVRGNLFAATEGDSIALRISARELLDADGIREEDMSEAMVQDRAAQLLRQLVFEQAATQPITALRPTPVSVEVQRFAQELRAEADAILASKGIEMKAKIAHAVAEIEAA